MARTSARRRSAAALLCLASVLATSGCQLAELQFRNDHRLHFSAPRARALVTAPLRVSWSMDGFQPTGLDGSRDTGKGAFAVFVDRAPMPVGKDLRWLAHGDNACKRDPRCPDASYLADHGVYVTTDSSITLDTFPQVGDGVGDEQHYLNIVLVDGTGHRIGESAWYRPFQSKRRTS